MGTERIVCDHCKSINTFGGDDGINPARPIQLFLRYTLFIIFVFLLFFATLFGRVIIAFGCFLNWIFEDDYPFSRIFRFFVFPFMEVEYHDDHSNTYVILLVSIILEMLILLAWIGG